MTLKLYETTPAVTRFTARVLSCTAVPQGYAVVLDQTAFFPEGGGQPCDRGTLGGLPVTAVTIRQEVVTHLLPQPLEPGSQVTGEIDRDFRLDVTQQHTGEHILSGTLYRLFGAQNVGFHIGQPYIRMDMDLPLTPQQLAQAEAQANRVVQQDVPVHAWYPDRDTLDATPYRSKKELEGPVRLVEIPGADCCACCGTHLERTGMVGPILIVSSQHYKGGVRLEVACGSRAVARIQEEHRQMTALSGLLSAKPLLVEEAARRMAAENQTLKGQLSQLTARLTQALAETAQPGRPEIRLCPEFNPDGLRRLCMAFTQTSGALGALFAPGSQGLQYALCLPGQDVRPLAKALNSRFSGRGGGSAGFCQGCLTQGTFEEIKQYLEETINADAL